MKKVIFDSSALIPASKYALEGKRICEYLADYVEIHIPTAVHDEIVAPPEKFAGEAAIQSLIAQNKIVVEAVQPAAAATEILSGYKLGRGEQEAILLYLQKPGQFDGIIVDDYVAAIVCRRLQIGNMLLLDLIVLLEQERLLPHDLAVAMLVKIAPRYNHGFVEHSLSMLGEPKIDLAPPPKFVKDDFERYLAGKFPSAQEASWRQRFAQSYRDYAAGLLSLGGMAQFLQASVPEMERLLDEMKLPFSAGLDELAELWAPARASARWLKQSQSNRELH
jgi:hypothetical protein